jgi:hypothetical protein
MLMRMTVNRRVRRMAWQTRLTVLVWAGKEDFIA